MSAERDEMDERHERSEALWEWLRLLRKTAPKETQIDLICSRFDNATDADERRDLKDHLQILLHQTDRIDEALQLGDAWIAENPNDVFAYTAKSRTYLWVDDLDNALTCVELALVCARRCGLPSVALCDRSLTADTHVCRNTWDGSGLVGASGCPALSTNQHPQSCWLDWAAGSTFPAAS